MSGGGGVKVGTKQRHGALVVDRASEGKREGAVSFSKDRGSDVWEMGCYFERFWVRFEGGSGGAEPADSLGEGRGRFHKNLTRV